MPLMVDLYPNFQEKNRNFLGAMIRCGAVFSYVPIALACGA
jgi:hypothetical protein